MRKSTYLISNYKKLSCYHKGYKGKANLTYSRLIININVNLNQLIIESLKKSNR